MILLNEIICVVVLLVMFWVVVLPQTLNYFCLFLIVLKNSRLLPKIYGLPIRKMYIHSIIDFDILGTVVIWRQLKMPFFNLPLSYRHTPSYRVQKCQLSWHPDQFCICDTLLHLVSGNRIHVQAIGMSRHDHKKSDC